MRSFLLLYLLAPIMAFKVKINHVGVANPVQVMQSRIMEKEIKAILECFRDILQNGDPEIGLPPLDPLALPAVNVNLDKLGLQGISGHVNVQDVKGTGHSNWNLKKLKISVTIIPIGAKIQVDVVWPAGVLTGSYDVDASIFSHTIKGAGAVDGRLEKRRFTLDSQVKINPI